jgi:hypothetical protein
LAVILLIKVIVLDDGDITNNFDMYYQAFQYFLIDDDDHERQIDYEEDDEDQIYGEEEEDDDLSVPFNVAKSNCSNFRIFLKGQGKDGKIFAREN